MIVPAFRLSQTPDTVTLEITAKYIKLNELDFIIEGEMVLFYCKPYHLKLWLTGSLEDELVSSKYDSSRGLFSFVMKKSTPGEHFKNLDLIIRLLSPVNEKKKVDKVLILDDEENVRWEDTQETSYKYGFAMKGLYDFHRVIEEYADVLKIDPRKVDVEERTKLQRLDEEMKFNKDHYVADFAEEESLIKSLIDVKSPWTIISKDTISFDENEIDILKNLPNKNYNLTEQQRAFCYTSLIDILFAYCYDCRTTSFEGNSESGWTVAEIAASLSWLSGFTNVQSAVVSAFRRSLIYPLYRNFSLSKKVFQDVKVILQLGEICILKCLLHIYSIFLTGGYSHFILNDIFIKDYIIYVGKWNDSEWASLVQEVMDLEIEKKDLDLNLEHIEKQFLQGVLYEHDVDSDDDDSIKGAREVLHEDMKRTFLEKLNAFKKESDTSHDMKLADHFGKLSIDINADQI